MQLAAFPKFQRLRTSSLCLSAALLLGISGCRHAIDDTALATTVQSQLAADTSLNGEPIQATVKGGIVTLDGSVQNDAQKTIADRA